MGSDVLIVGGGIIGLTAAHFLADANLTVTVVDRGEPGRGASWAGAGILPPGDPGRAATPVDRLRALSTSRFADYSARLRDETGVHNGYSRCGGIEFLRESEMGYLARWLAEGIEVRGDLTPPAPLSEAERGEPSRDGEGLGNSLALSRPCSPLSASERGAGGVRSLYPCYLPGFAQVRNPRHLRALIAACLRAGVVVRAHAPVAEFVWAGGKVVGVRLATGEVLHAGRIIVAAGAWAGPLLGQLGVAVPVTPVRGQMVLFDAGKPLGGPILLVGKRYVVPRGDGLVLVGASEEPGAGFEAVTTPEAVAELAEFGRALLPGLAGAEIAASWAGLRPGSPDGRPTIGVVPGRPNVVVAGGHFRAGIQQSIGTALLVRDLVLGEPPALPVGPFAPDRVVGLPEATAFRS